MEVKEYHKVIQSKKEKILHDNLPMAIIPKMNGNRCCFSPLGNLPLIEIADSNFSGLLSTIFEGRGDLKLNLPASSGKHHNYLKFHSPQENLKYILGPKIDSDPIIFQDTAFQMNTENFYIKVSKASPEASSETLIKNLTMFLQSTECRHIDLSDIDLNDTDVYQLKSLFDNPLKQVITLILSNNKIGADELSELLIQLERSRIDFVFLDRNLISFSLRISVR